MHKINNENEVFNFCIECEKLYDCDNNYDKKDAILRTSKQNKRRCLMIIDSAEKLLSIHNKMPLYLLLDKMQEKEWQFVFTLRKSVFERFKKIILNSQDVQVEVLTVPLLNDTSLTTFLEKGNILRIKN